MKIAIIGLPNSGKTTVFNALTRGNAETTSYSSGQLEPNIATVKVPDGRLTQLTTMFNPRKITPADVQYVDVAGISGDSEGGGLPGALLNYIQGSDAFVHVVRAFEDDNVPHPQNTVNAARDIATLDLELMFSDMAIIERRLARLVGEITKMSSKDKELRIAERDALLRLQSALESEVPVRDVDLSEDEDKLLKGYQFLSGKPMLLVLNTGDNQIAAPPTVEYNHRRSDVVAISAKIEADLAQMDDEDATTFMEDLGITQAARELAITKSYNLLGLISFLTAGPDEVRAWTIRRQTPAVEAAGTIHSDIQRGFIRAQVVAFNDLMRAGSMVEAKKQGTVRMEGKTYIVQDGDLCEFLFNI